jgi:hypothetical protein
LGEPGSGNDVGMPTDRSARRVLGLALGAAAVLDPTGTSVYRIMRPVLAARPPQPQSSDPLQADPLQAAMSTIMSAHREAVHRDAVADARGRGGVSLPHEGD